MTQLREVIPTWIEAKASKLQEAAASARKGYQGTSTLSRMCHAVADAYEEAAQLLRSRAAQLRTNIENGDFDDPCET